MNHFLPHSIAQKISRALAVILLVVMTSGNPQPVFAVEKQYENAHVFGALPAFDKNKQLESCVAGLRDFLYITIVNGFSTPNNDIKDYWRDFFLAPLHFNDVFGVQLQLNKARYEVIGTFLRCDVERFNQVKDVYYKLDEELYFLRHFIDTASLIGAPSYVDQISLESRKSAFSNEVVAYILKKTPDGDELKKQALYSGYFDLLVAKYRHKLVQYVEDGSSSDDATVALKEKLLKLGKTIKSIKEVGTELNGLGNDMADAAVAIKESFVPENSTNSGLYDLIAGVANRFDICASTDEDRYCASDGVKYLNELGAIKESPEQRQKNLFKTSKTEPKSFDQVLTSIEETKRDDVADLDEAQMLTRYEILYGRVGGAGIGAMVNKVDELNTLMKIGTLPQLEKIYNCVNDIEDKQCK